MTDMTPNAKELSQEKDLELLFEAMKNCGNGSFDLLDQNEFFNPEIAERFNKMVTQHTDRNNRYLARINDAQLRIGDTSCLKTMFEQITVQQSAIEKLQSFRKDITDDNRPVVEANEEFLSLVLQVQNSLSPCIDDIRNLADTLRSLAADSLNTTGFEDPEESESTKLLRTAYESANRCISRMTSMKNRANDMAKDANELFHYVEKNSNVNQGFLDSVDFLTTSSSSLSAECLSTGRHLNRISRDIDNARNDMFRHFSKPTLHDRLRVYETDHVTLAWRLYNNIMEFEALKITQVNNPTNCKFGIWLNSFDDPQITESECYQKLRESHLKLHENCVECFIAKQNYDVPLALEKFNDVLASLTEFQQAMEDTHIYLRSIGITEETDVWKFRG